MNNKVLDNAAFQDGTSVIVNGTMYIQAKLVVYGEQKYAVNPHAIFTINCTNRCNAQCFFCYNGLTFMPSAEYFDSKSSELSRAIEFARLSGISVVSISGGEPTLCPEILLFLVKKLKSAGFPIIRLHTNGFLLNQSLTNDGMSKPLWFLLMQFGLNDISISVADYREERNFAIMRMNNIPVLQTVLPQLVQSDMRVRLSCYLCPQGIHSLEDIKRYLRYANQNGVTNVIFRKAPSERTLDLALFEEIVAGLQTDGWKLFSYHKKSDALICNLSRTDGTIGCVMLSCVSEEPDPDQKIRRLIYMPDKVLYTSWIDPSSYLFASDAAQLVSSLLTRHVGRGDSHGCVKKIVVPDYVHQSTEQKIDLHVHSMVSDGLKSPCAVLQAAASAGIQKLVFTEHNCLHDSPEALAEFAQKQGIHIPFWGVEVSTVYSFEGIPRLKFHLLIYAKSASEFSFLKNRYNPNTPQNQHLKSLFDKLKATYMIDKLWEDIFRIEDIVPTRKKMFTRTPVAQAISECCNMSSETAKKLFLPPLSDSERYRDYLDTADIIRLAHENGCATVLAHPGWVRPYKKTECVNEDFLWLAIADLTRSGLDGVEISHRLNNSDQREKLYLLAHGLGLIPTGGSDYHGKSRCLFGVNGTTEGNLQCLMARMR